MKNNSYQSLISRLEFKETKFGTEVSLDGRVLGAISCDSSLEGKTLCLRNLRISIARQSNTAELRTLCGCTKMIELNSTNTEDWIEPLRTHFIYGINPIEVSRTAPSSRKFEFTYRYNPDGFKIFEEVYHG